MKNNLFLDNKLIKSKVKNSYTVEDKKVFLTIVANTGGVSETKICNFDLEDLHKVSQYLWGVSIGKRDGYIGVVSHGKVLVNGESKNLRLCRWVMNTTDTTLQVDHIDHDTLNNCKANLRLVTQSENQHNRKGANKTNLTTGVRGVAWDAKYNRYAAYLSVGGKYVYRKVFKDLDSAVLAVKEARETFCPASFDRRYDL